MASEWAMKQAVELYRVVFYAQSPNGINKVAVALDAARKQGLQEAAEIADAQSPIIAAIDRNTEKLEGIKSCLWWVALMLVNIWIVMMGAGCPKAKAAPLLPIQGVRR